MQGALERADVLDAHGEGSECSGESLVKADRREHSLQHVAADEADTNEHRGPKAHGGRQRTAIEPRTIPAAVRFGADEALPRLLLSRVAKWIICDVTIKPTSNATNVDAQRAASCQSPPAAAVPSWTALPVMREPKVAKRRFVLASTYPAEKPNVTASVKAQNRSSLTVIVSRLSSR